MGQCCCKRSSSTDADDPGMRLVASKTPSSTSLTSHNNNNNNNNNHNNHAAGLSYQTSNPERAAAAAAKMSAATSYNVACTLCNKAIPTLFETQKDARGKPYHSLCIKCAKCGRSQGGETVTVRDGKLYCRAHSGGDRRADADSSLSTSLAESAKMDTAHVDVADLCETMIDKIVMMPPTCVACGGTFSIKVR